MDNTAVCEAITEQRVHELLLRYIKALDNQDMKGWLACFSQSGSYICTTRENVEQGLPVATMMDDTRARLEDRVKTIEEVWAGTYEDYQTRHFIQSLQCGPRADGSWQVESNFVVTYTTANGNMSVLAAGVYYDEVVLEDDEVKLASRRAVLDSVLTPRYLVYPI